MTTPGADPRANEIAAANQADPAARLQSLVDLVLMPAQTPQQMQSGELSFTQLREVAVQINNLVQGNPAGGVLSYEQVREYLKDNAPKIQGMQGAIELVNNRVGNVEKTMEPVINRTEAALKSVMDQTDSMKQTLEHHQSANLTAMWAQAMARCWVS